ncbi:DUF397 domain-containing protein [Streptomyces boncukensis]|uniref:DUF397 domain-containing protein n=1 Tax=Streptomyces boncukensis TaxID=2711219 RepID=A0A6G4X2B8_9ACTN|nr:DUF397 domain-containing protein [Streptomyces boncukensis]NGO70997.1 DUF397 domain-containing protein [Streptomyces boncukensis]
MKTHPVTVTASELEEAHWFKSSYSNAGGNCVETADLTRTARSRVVIRDSKDPHGPALLLPHEQFAAFIADVRAGRFGI